jgi:DNA replication protein DnaC
MNNYDEAALQQRLSQLKLAGIRKTLDIRLSQAAEGMGCSEFLGLLLEDELTNRQDNRKKELHRAAHFPFEKGVEDFDFTFQPGLKKQAVLELAAGRFLESKTNIIFIGQPGTGKTHLSVALGLRAISMGKTVLFTTLWDMLDNLQQAKADYSFARKALSYCRPDLLIIDELGYKALSPPAVQDLFEIIGKRYEQKSTIITSNRSIAEWDKIFLDKTLTTALLDRLLHHSQVFEIQGESYRMKHRAANTPTEA